jgi:hypothetical protein
MTKYTITALKEMLEKKLSHNFGVTPEQASDDIFYKATVLVLLDIMSERKAQFKKAVDEQETKTIYYLSMEFLMGRSLKNNLYNLDLTETMRKALKSYKVNLDNYNETEKYSKYSKFYKYKEEKDLYIFYVYEGYYNANCLTGEAITLYDFITGKEVYNGICSNKSFLEEPTKELDNLQLYKYEFKKDNNGKLYLYGYNPVNK